MKRFVLLDTTPIPDNGGALCLFEYGEDFVIKIQGGDGGQLMNTRMHGSEDALAEIPCRKVAGRPGSRVLIGGLGMGFTLASALKHLGKTAEVVVAELVPGVVEWNRGPLGEKSGTRCRTRAPLSAWKTWPRCCKPSPTALMRSCSTSTTAPKA